MESQEFLETLSPKAKMIVEKYSKDFMKKKTFNVSFSNMSYVSFKNDNAYLIHINENGRNSIEYTFLHEFFHCVQHEEGFPHLITYDEENIDFASKLSSYILDYNIHCRLEKYEYYEHKNEINYMYSLYYKLFKSSKGKKVKVYNTKEERIDCGSSLAFLSLSKGNNKQIKSLLSLVGTTDIKIYSIYKMFYKWLTENDYNTPEGVSTIFDLLVDKLDLNDVIYKG